MPYEAQSSRACWLATTLSVDGPHVVAVHFAFTAMGGPFLLEKIMAAHT